MCVCAQAVRVACELLQMPEQKGDDGAMGAGFAFRENSKGCKTLLETSLLAGTLHTVASQLHI